MELSLFNATMSRWRFLDVIKYLRFDVKSERKRQLETDKSCLASSIWNSFTENCQKSYNPNSNITVLSMNSNCCCLAKQDVNLYNIYMTNKPDNFGPKFWVAAEVESKYLHNGFPCLRKNSTRNGDVSAPTDLVM